jgi:hypothetical protein
MSIETLDQALAGFRDPQGFYKIAPGTPVIGTMYSLWRANGNPGMGPIPTGNLSGRFYNDTSDTGLIPIPAAVNGDTNYLARFSLSSLTAGTLMLIDRIWSDSLSPVGIGSQLIYSGSFPRSRGTGGGDSSGIGISLAIEVYTALGASSATPKVSYIDQKGVGDTGIAAYAIPSSAAIGTFIPIMNSVGRRGFRSVIAYNNMTTLTSGVLGLTAYRTIARVGVPAAGLEASLDLLTSGFPSLYEGSAPSLVWIAGSTTVPRILGTALWAKG